MRTEVITACTIDGAVERILEELKEDIAGTISGRHNVIYFDGWDGLGASAVLREVGRRLAPATSAPAAGLEFSQIIHIDCSKWESRRAMQRSLAKQLNLPPPVMRMFDAQDEEDDYKGVDKGSRAEIPQVADAIYRRIQKQQPSSSRILVIFNNGSCEEIDLDSLGLPLSGYSSNKALWSFQGGFRLYPRTKVNTALESKQRASSSTDVVLSAASGNLDEDMFFKILRCEAQEVALALTRMRRMRRMINAGVDGIDWPAAAADCFLYTMRLCGMGGQLIDYDLATHGCNYWICDGIIQPRRRDVVVSTGHGAAASSSSADVLWLSCDALKRDMRLDADYQDQSLRFPTSPVAKRQHERTAYWTSPAYGSTLIPDPRGHVPRGMFQQHDKLCVLKLSACTFSLMSPPFLCCQNLRFLWLDHCHCQEESSSSRDGGAGKNEEDVRRCFQNLWVLDVRYSSSKFLSEKMMDFMAQLRELHVMGQEEFHMDTLQGRLPNIRKLRVTKSRASTASYVFSGNVFSGKHKMELLDWSGNTGNMESFPWVSSCNSLGTIIINGSISLQEISLSWCATLQNLHLSGLFPQLYRLDITGTAVKTLDLSAVTAPKLDNLFLLDCGKLYAILWPPETKRKRYLGKLRMGTIHNNSTAAATAGMMSLGGSPDEFDWYISARDARILGSLAPVKDYFGANDAYVVISTTPSPTRYLHADATSGSSSSRQQEQGTLQPHKESNSIYSDVTTPFNKVTIMDLQAKGGDYDASAIMCICPPPPTRTIEPSLYLLRQTLYQDCYMRLEDKMMTTTLQAGHQITVPGFVCDAAKILHVQDSLFITSIFAAPLGSSWNRLEWCRVERCPRLECVFSPQLGAVPEGNTSGINIFKELKTIWVSRLIKARYVLEYPGSEVPRCRAFAGLTLLHLYGCPRLVYAVPLQRKTMFLENLETIEIMWCGDLNVAFNLCEETSDHESYVASWHFPNLKLIHLHELPRLQGIFNDPWNIIQAPKLETVRIRGCWSLMTLPPFIDKSDMVLCDCEKEWWDRMEKHHQRALAYSYRPIHPRYFKKTMLRGSPLR